MSSPLDYVWVNNAKKTQWNSTNLLTKVANHVLVEALIKRKNEIALEQKYKREILVGAIKPTNALGFPSLVISSRHFEGDPK